MLMLVIFKMETKDAVLQKQLNGDMEVDHIEVHKIKVDGLCTAAYLHLSDKFVTKPSLRGFVKGQTGYLLEMHSPVRTVSRLNMYALVEGLRDCHLENLQKI